MKYLAKIEQTKEIELTFPYYTKDGNTLYCIISPSKTITLYKGTNSIDCYTTIIGAEYEEIRESEFMNTFDNILGNILSTLNR